MEYLKQQKPHKEEEGRQIEDTVKRVLADIQVNGEEAASKYAKQLDNWTADIILSEEKKAELISQVPQNVIDEIDFIHDHVRNSEIAQKNSIAEFECESFPGVKMRQKLDYVNIFLMRNGTSLCMISRSLKLGFNK